MSFVGTNQQPLCEDKLIALLEKISIPSSYYFLRWKHRVGGFWERRKTDFPNLKHDIGDRTSHPLWAYPTQKTSQNNPVSEPFPSPEGQLFNSTLEIRWKRQSKDYQILILHSQDIQTDFHSIQLKPLPGKWETREQNALIYSPKETRFPKNLNTEQLNIAQRYFLDNRTAIVHFVALTVKNKNG